MANTTISHKRGMIWPLTSFPATSLHGPCPCASIAVGTTAEKTMRDPQSNLVSMLQRWGNYPPPEFLYLSVSHFDTNRQTETCIFSRPANKPTNSGATKPDHRRLACDHWRPQCHVLWASLTYPWRERAKLMRGWAAAVDVGCRCVFLY